MGSREVDADAIADEQVEDPDEAARPDGSDEDEAYDDDGWDDREPCPDGSCVGTMDAGVCRVCGAT